MIITPYSVLRTHRRRSARGFTLVEIVLVLAIIALLLGVVVKNLGGVKETANEVKAKADVDGFVAAIEAYKMKGLRYPTTEQGLRALVERPSSAPQPAAWRSQMGKLPPDPWSRDYQYKFPGVHNAPNGFDVYSLGSDGQDGTDDDVGNW